MTELAAILGHVEGPLRIVAGAGTGKTRAIVQKMVSLVAGGHAAPREILALTFTNKAAEEMRDRVVLALRADPAASRRPDLDELTVLTFHAFGAQILREHGFLVGIERDAAVVSRAKTWQMMLDVLDEVTFDEIDVIATRLGAFVDRLVELASGLSDHLVGAEELERYARTRLERAVSDDHAKTLRQRVEIVPVLHEYERRKRAYNLVDYGDQIALVCRLLRSHDDVLEALREQYRFVLVDEYQDTNVAQRTLLQLLTTREGRAGNITVVGDNDQSIYAFRGATVENILHFDEDFRGAVSLPLSVNYRSGPEILRVAQAVIERIPEDRRLPKSLVAAAGAAPARVEYFVAESQAAEADHIARMVGEAKPWADSLDGAESRRGWSAFGVLVSKNQPSGPIADAFRRRGIPVEVVGLGGFFERPEVLDVLAVLRAAADPSDNLALARILHGPRYRIGDRDLIWLGRAAKGTGARRRRDLGLGWEEDHGYRLIDAIERLEDVAELSEEARSRLTGFREELRELIRTANRMPLADFVAHVIEHIGIADECAASPFAEARAAERSIGRLRDLAARFTPLAGRSDLRAFLEYLELAEETDEPWGDPVPSEDESVKLVTVHRAKGLEFPCVFMPAMTAPWPFKGDPRDECRQWWVIPHALRGDAEWLPAHDGDDAEFRSALAAYEAEEHRRIAYVALTRAKRRLVLSHAWWYGANKRSSRPSEFWAEIVETGVPVRLFEHAPPEANPGLPPAGEPVEPDRSRDWRPLLRDASFAPPAVPDGFDEQAAALRADLEALARAETASPPEAPRREVPVEVSVSALLDYVRCPRLYYERHVLGLPEPVSWAARRGTEVHRWIEERTWESAPMLDEVAGAGPETLGAALILPEDISLDPVSVADEGDEHGDARAIALLRANFESSRFARLTPKHAELPFALRLGRVIVRGRIDAIYEAGDGALEIVDYKTGTHPGDPKQLELYARAVREVLGAQSLRLLFLDLRHGREVGVEERDTEWIDDAVGRLARGEMACAGASCGVHAMLSGATP